MIEDGLHEYSSVRAHIPSRDVRFILLAEFYSVGNINIIIVLQNTYKSEYDTMNAVPKKESQWKSLLEPQRL
jgi:hypothetical protein